MNTTPANQIKLANVLKYFQYGDYAIFKQACDMVFGVDAKIDRFFYANMMFGTLISGLIETIQPSNARTQWSVCFKGDVVIPTAKPKIVVTEALRDDTKYSPVVVDKNNAPIIWANINDIHSDQAKNSFLYDAPFQKYFPSFCDIDVDLIISEKYSENLGKHLQIYSPECAIWEDKNHINETDGGLIRVRSDYSEFIYYIALPKIKTLFNIRHPEWAFICASILLNWPNDYIYEKNANGISVARVVRLPSLINRFLFASSACVRVGAKIEYIGVESWSVNWLDDYLKNQSVL